MKREWCLELGFRNTAVINDDSILERLWTSGKEVRVPGNELIKELTTYPG